MKVHQKLKINIYFSPGQFKIPNITSALRYYLQENLLRTMIQIENSFFALAEASERNCLVICDRGSMDASAFVTKKEWEEILVRNQCDEIDIRYNYFV